ncbi:MAG: vanadium-dependent haloperoxidase [Pyrinomonadaceae bacterium]
MTTIFRKIRGLICALAAISIVMLTMIPVQAKSTTRRVRTKRAVVVASDAVLLQWNETATDATLGNPPFPSARWMAIVQLAAFEAVNSITGKYEPYLGTVTASPDASAAAAAAQATYRALKLLNLGATLNPSLEARLAATLSTIPDGQSKTDGIAAGDAAANAMVADRASDQVTGPLFIPSATPGLPYEWQITPGCAGGVFKHWSVLRPFGIASPSQFRSDPPPALDSGLYAQDLNEVRAYGDTASLVREDWQTNVAKLYQTAPGQYTWNETARQIAATRNDEITDTARTLALMNMALNDAYISGFETKYYYNTWRPVTSILRADEDGNKRTTAGPFTPLMATPCFPSYPSNHGTGSGAARTVLVRAYGRFGHDITVDTPTNVGLTSLHYTDLRDMTDEIANARIWAGLHYRYDQDAAEVQGHAVGQYVYNNSLKKSGRE